LLATACLALIMFTAQPVFCSDEQELIYELRLDELVLSTSIPLYERNGELFLPVGELADLLSLAVRYQGEGKASGYIMDESRTIRIDAVTGTVVLQGVRSTFDKKLAIIQQDDMFIAARVISSWFPVNITVDKAQQIVTLGPREKLPLQQLLERKARFLELKKASLDDDPSFTDITPPYRLLAPPVVDFATSVDFSGRNLGHVQHRQSLIASGDLAALSATINLSNNNGTLDRADFTAGRVDSKGELLGALRATRFAVGAVQTPAFAGISRVSDPMYGFLVTNRPTTLPTQFSSHDIEGPLPQGWDVELYYNGIPIAYHPPSSDTIYRFNDLPLKIGLNDFRVVLHGPNGETRVENQRFLLDGLMVQPGKVQYTVGANRELMQGDQGQEGTGTVAVDIGFTKKLSGFIGVFSAADSEGRYSHYADTGLKGTLGSTFMTLDHVRRSEGGSATLFNLKGYRSGLHINVDQVFLDDFVSEVFPEEPDPLASLTSLRLEGSLPWKVRIPFGVESTLNIRKSGEVSPSLIGRISGEINRISLSQQIAANFEKDMESTLGVTQIGTYMKDFSLRGQINYQLSPELSLSSVQLAATKEIGGACQLNGQVSHTPSTSTYDFTAGVSKRVGVVGFMVNAGISNKGNYNVSSQLTVSAGVNPRTGQIVTDAFSMSSYGGLTMLAYVDSNGNKAYDEGEQPLVGVRFTLNGGATLGATGKDGILFIKQLPVGMPYDISIAQETIPEPFLVPSSPGYRVEPRPGVFIPIDFGFVPSGEVDGMVQFRSKEELVPVAGVRVHLVNEKGTVVAKTTSEQSGYFLFKKVKGGTYTVQLAEQEAERLAVRQENSAELIMPRDGDMLSDNDLIIWRPEAEQSTASLPGSLAPLTGQSERVNPENTPAGKDAVQQASQKAEPPRVEKIRRLAEAGDPKAQKALGWLYSDGKEITADKQEAVKWYQRAAEKGEVEAQMALGWLYFSGQGVDRNLTKAAYWYDKAAAQGNAQAKKKLKRIRRSKSATLKGR